MPNLLPLETWRALFGIHPIHYWGLANATQAPVTSSCNTVVREHAWQDAMAVGRQEIREAIETAEQRLHEWLGYPVAPIYITKELPWPGSAWGSDGRWQTVQLPDGYVQAIGTETLTSLGTSSIEYSDTDGDGLDDTFEAIWTPLPDGVSVDELALYFSAEDRIDDDPLSERWRVLPIRTLVETSEDDGVITVHLRGKAWQLVKPYLLEQVGATPIDPANLENFVATLAVYVRRPETPQATLTWETAPYPWFCSCATDSSGDPAAIGTASARVGIRDGLHGIVAPAEAVYDADSETWSAVSWSACRPPDRVTIQYLAGVPLVGGQMEPAWRMIVARLAAAELTAPICACKEANRALHTWQFDVARTGGAGDEAYGAVTQEDLANPFGTRRGHIYAWKQVKHLRQLRGFLPG
jgi:hypothetical protein